MLGRRMGLLDSNLRFIFCGRMFARLRKMSCRIADAQLLEGDLADSSNCFPKLRLEAIARVSLEQGAHQLHGFH